MKVAETSEVSSMSKTPTLNEIVSELESIEPQKVANDAYDHLLELWADAAKEAKAASKAGERAYECLEACRRFRGKAGVRLKDAQEAMEAAESGDVQEQAGHAQQAVGAAQSALGALSDARRARAEIQEACERASLAAHLAENAAQEARHQGDHLKGIICGVGHMANIRTDAAHGEVREIVEEAENLAKDAEEALDEANQYWKDSGEVLQDVRHFADRACLASLAQDGWL